MLEGLQWNSSGRITAIAAVGGSGPAASASQILLFFRIWSVEPRPHVLSEFTAVSALSSSSISNCVAALFLLIADFSVGGMESPAGSTRFLDGGIVNFSVGFSGRSFEALFGVLGVFSVATLRSGEIASLMVLGWIMCRENMFGLEISNRVGTGGTRGGSFWSIFLPAMPLALPTGPIGSIGLSGLLSPPCIP